MDKLFWVVPDVLAGRPGPDDEPWNLYDKVLLEEPLHKAFIQCDPALWNLKILSAPRGTNFAVREDEWAAIRTWLELK